MVRDSTALSLLDANKRRTHGHEVDQHVMALVAGHGPDAVDRAVQAVADRLHGTGLPWPSDVRMALEGELGPLPIEAKPHPLDEAQRAQRMVMVDLASERPDWLGGDGLTAEERRAANEARRAGRGAA